MTEKPTIVKINFLFIFSPALSDLTMAGRRAAALSHLCVFQGKSCSAACKGSRSASAPCFLTRVYRSFCVAALEVAVVEMLCVAIRALSPPLGSRRGAIRTRRMLRRFDRA